MKRSTTPQQDKDFQDKLFGAITANDALNSIKALLGIDSSWVLEWVVETFTPDDVFDDSDLSKWAENNGYTLSE